MSEKEKCFGCFQDGDCVIQDNFVYYGTENKCPCKDCLIKSMCQRDCYEIDEFLKTIHIIEREDK